MKFKKRKTCSAIFVALAMILLLADCASRPEVKKSRGDRQGTSSGHLKSAKPYVVNGQRYYPLDDAYGYEQTGTASWYGPNFDGKPTASGEIYDMDQMTAAHKTLPLQTMAEVTRLDTGEKIVVRINDRGPFVNSRIIDLSRASARALGMERSGTAPVRVVALAKGRPGRGDSAPVPTAPLPDFNSGVFWVQVGAFGQKENAQRVRERMLLPQEMIRFQQVTSASGLSLIRVQAGPFMDKAVADQSALDLINQGFSETFVLAE